MNKTFTIDKKLSVTNLSPIPEVDDQYDSVASEEDDFEESYVSKPSFNSSRLIHKPFSTQQSFNENGSEIYNRKFYSHAKSSENENPLGLGTSKQVLPNTRLRSGFTDYEVLCASSLSLPASERTVSPVKSQIRKKWGKSAKNWSLWTAWDTSSLSFPGLNHDDYLSKHSEEFKLCDFLSKINHLFGKYHLDEKGWEAVGDNVVVVRVMKQNFEERFRPFTQEIQLDGQQFIFQLNHGHVSYSKLIPVKLLACAGLAEIMESVINHGDILVINGGYDELRSNQGIPLIALNFNRENHTQILRLPGNLFGRITLYEKVEPLAEEKRFKFTYFVRRGSYQRMVEQHRIFNRDEFCRKVTDTLAYSRNRWDFPVPLVRGANVHSLYEMFCSRDFKVPPPSPHKSPSKRDERTTHRNSTALKRGSESRQSNSSLGTDESFPKGYGDRGYANGIRHVKTSAKSCRCVITLCWIVLGLLFTIFGALLVISWMMSDGCPASILDEDMAAGKNSLVSKYAEGRLLGLNRQDENRNPSGSEDEDNVRLVETIWQKRERYIYNQDWNTKVFSWVKKQSRVVVGWIERAIEWIGKNCNLEIFLSKLEFNMVGVLEAF